MAVPPVAAPPAILLTSLPRPSSFTNPQGWRKKLDLCRHTRMHSAAINRQNVGYLCAAFVAKWFATAKTVPTLGGGFREGSQLAGRLTRREDSWNRWGGKPRQSVGGKGGGGGALLAWSCTSKLQPIATINHKQWFSLNNISSPIRSCGFQEEKIPAFSINKTNCYAVLMEGNNTADRNLHSPQVQVQFPQVHPSTFRWPGCLRTFSDFFYKAALK